MSDQFLKVCTCGQRYTEETWLALPFGRIHELDGQLYETRRCICKTSLWIEIRVQYLRDEINCRR